MSMENIQVQKCVNVVFMILMLSETGPQADKMDTSNKRTFLLYSPIPQMANITKNKTHIRIRKRKIHFLYTECPANVCDRRKKKTSLYTAKHNLEPSFLCNSKL